MNRTHTFNSVYLSYTPTHTHFYELTTVILYSSFKDGAVTKLLPSQDLWIVLRFKILMSYGNLGALLGAKAKRGWEVLTYPSA